MKYKDVILIGQFKTLNDLVAANLICVGGIKAVSCHCTKHCTEPPYILFFPSLGLLLSPFVCTLGCNGTLIRLYFNRNCGWIKQQQ